MPVIIDETAPILRAEISIVYAGTHDGESGRVEQPAEKIVKGISRERPAGQGPEEEYLAARVEVELLLQIVMFILNSEAQAVAALLPRQCVSSGIGLFVSAVIGERVGAHIEIVGDRDFRHAGE